MHFGETMVNTEFFVAVGACEGQIDFSAATVAFNQEGHQNKFGREDFKIFVKKTKR